MLKNVQAVILAGGASKRFQTGRSKLIEKVCGKEMIMYPLQLLDQVSFPVTMVLGFQQELVKAAINKYSTRKITYLYQEEALGTGHAVQISQNYWDKEHVLILGGDTPLLTPDIINKLCKKHIKTDADISFITAHGIDFENHQYSKVFINDNKIQVIDPTSNHPDWENQCCISGGVYIAKTSFLKKYINQLTKSSISNEYYLAELIQIASANNCKVVTTPVSFDAIRSIETLSDLWAVEHIKRSQSIKYWMDHGVRFANAVNVIIDEDVTIEPGAYVESGVHLLGKTNIASYTKIGANSYIKDSTINKHVTIKSQVVIENATIKEHSTIAPFSYIANQVIATIEKNEIKQTKETTISFTPSIKAEDIHQHEL